MAKEYNIPEELKKPFKILTHQILARGEKSASLEVYVDYDGNFSDIDVFYTDTDYSMIFQDDVITDYIENITNKIVDEVQYNDNEIALIFTIDAANKTMTLKVREHFIDTKDEDLKLNYSQIIRKYPNFDELIEEVKKIEDIVRIEYNGGGDEGAVIPYLYGYEDEEQIEMSGDLYEDFLWYLYNLLSSNYGYWADGDGGDGEFIINCIEKSITNRHRNFFTNTRPLDYTNIYHLS